MYLIPFKMIEMNKMRNTMPSKPPPISRIVAAQLGTLGNDIRTRRKALGISATAAAESAGMSRVTWHRIESGEPSVTMGAYANALSALDLAWGVSSQAAAPQGASPDRRDWIPARVRLSEYPELKKLAWQLHGTDDLTPAEALDIYERNARHLDEAALLPHERDLIDALRKALGGGRRDV